MFSKSIWLHLLTQCQSKYLLLNPPSLVTLLTIRLQRVCNKLFQRIFVIWYCKKGVNRCVDRFFRGGSKFFKKGHIVFLPIYCQEQPSKGALWNSCSALEAKNLEKYVVRTLHSNTSIVNIWNKSRGYHTQKASRTIKLTFTLYSTYPSQKCRVSAIRDTVM